MLENKQPRRSNDQYNTVPALAEALVACLPFMPGDRALEPSAGGGAFLRAMQARLGAERVWANDVDRSVAARALATPGRWRTGDFASLRAPTGHFQWVVGNPPYSEAEAHARHALSLAPCVAFLMRLQWLGSNGRNITGCPQCKYEQALWEQYPPRRVSVITPRPSFTGGGTDRAQEYGFIWWDQGYSGPTIMDRIIWRT